MTLEETASVSSPTTPRRIDGYQVAGSYETRARRSAIEPLDRPSLVHTKQPDCLINRSLTGNR